MSTSVVDPTRPHSVQETAISDLHDHAVILLDPESRLNIAVVHANDPARDLPTAGKAYGIRRDDPVGGA
jgi:hypothetical protein